MDDVELIQNLTNLCRLCLSPDEPKSSIFDGDDSSVLLSSKIQACLAIQILSSDKLSTLICKGCVKNVNQWHTYRESCLKAQDKLQQWHMQQMSAQTGVTIKQEPIDLEFEIDQNEAITESRDSSHYDQLNQSDGVSALQITNEQSIRAEKDVEKSSKIDTPSRRRTRSLAVPVSPPILLQESEKSQTISKPYCTVEVKDEPIQDDEYDSTLEIESVTGGEILPNPVAMNCMEKDRVMEADSTQRLTSKTFRTKKKVRRGPHTHLRHKHTFRKKCVYCQINLHSKYSYARHMERFHKTDSDSEQKESKEKLQYALKQKHNSKNSQSTTFPERIRIKRNNSQDRDNENNYTENSLDMNSHRDKVEEPVEDVEDVEDVEEEIDNMDKNSDAPLSQVQQNIIGQLKTYSCYSCKQVFPDRRSTLNHLRQHLPDLRPFTCVACLTQFPDRSIYKDHCYTSFECAMKIAIVEPKSGLEKYFTCNMCSKSVSNRKELLHHLTSQHSEDQHANATPTSSKKLAKKTSDQASSSSNAMNWPPLPGPYENGNPAYNHACTFCGMIYKHERNLREHHQLCSRLPVHLRTSFACVHCGMTFLVLRKFLSHLTKLHRKTDIICSKCRKCFKNGPEYLTHNEKYHKNDDFQPSMDKEKSSASFESPLKDWNDFEAEVHANESRISRQKYSCALCGQEFPTRTELGEHRNLHLKVKIYSCVVCRSMFSSAGALEVHMKDHGIEDPAEQNAHTSCVEYEEADDTKDASLPDATPDPDSQLNHKKCKICDKTFSSSANQKRHVANVHRNSKNRRKCTDCNKFFSKKDSFEYHLKTEHGKVASSLIKCLVCNEAFSSRANLNSHYQTAHANITKTETPHACDICGKQFKEETSLKIHRGWHVRRSHKLINDMPHRNKTPLSSRPQANLDNLKNPSERPARARKSFPNSPPAKPLPQLQCQVCEDKFVDVTELRKHLWDVHCARSKSEKSYTTSDLQCELCTHTLPDKNSLERHLEWHMENPILSDNKNGLKRKRHYTPRELRTHRCEICGNFYTTRRSLLRHQKLHKISNAAANIKLQSVAKKPTQFPCNVCDKVFSTSMKLRKHRVRHFVNPASRKRHSVLEKSEFKCELCVKYYISEVGLQFHLEKTCPYRVEEPTSSPAKRSRITSPGYSGSQAEINPPKSTAVSSNNKANYSLPVGWKIKKTVNCSICHKSFVGKSLFYKHRKLMHQKEIFGRALVIDKKPSTATADSNNSESFHCDLCGKDFAGAINLKMHQSSVHKVKGPHTCSVCRSTFTTKVGMRNHMRVHSNDSFSCNICQRVFRARSAVFIHINRQHPEEYDLMQDNKDKLFTEIVSKSNAATHHSGSFVCDYCDLTFDSQKGYRIHAMKLHSVRP